MRNPTPPRLCPRAGAGAIPAGRGPVRPYAAPAPHRSTKPTARAPVSRELTETIATGPAAARGGRVGQGEGGEQQARRRAAIAEVQRGRLRIGGERGDAGLGRGGARDRDAELLGPPALAGEVGQQAVRRQEAGTAREGLGEPPPDQAPRRGHVLLLDAAEDAEHGTAPGTMGRFPGLEAEGHHDRGLAGDQAPGIAAHQDPLLHREAVEQERMDGAVEGTDQDVVLGPVPDRDGGVGEVGQGLGRPARQEVEVAQEAGMRLQQGSAERVPVRDARRAPAAP